jgi:hypothetical protein
MNIRDSIIGYYNCRLYPAGYNIIICRTDLRQIKSTIPGDMISQRSLRKNMLTATKITSISMTVTIGVDRIVISGANVVQIAGDANYDGNVNVGDAVYLINYVLRGGPVPCCP